MKIQFSLLLLILLGIGVYLANLDRLIKVTDDGNTLFYNYPAAVKVNGQGFFVSYVTKLGKIKVSHIGFDGQNIQDYIIHDYKKNGDDHAAPAIIYDELNNALYVATSYHSSDMYI